jgi:transposase
MKTRKFKIWTPGQRTLMPHSLLNWVEKDSLAHFILNLVATELDLSKIYSFYSDNKGAGGPAPYDPRMMTALLLYSYCTGVLSSRTIEKMTYELVPVRMITANQHPDHTTIALFRRNHLGAFSDIFIQVLNLCRDAGMVKLGHVSLDGSKFKGNASKRMASTYGRMQTKIPELKEKVSEILQAAQITDINEDELYGSEGKLDKVPEDALQLIKHIRKMETAKAQLEEEAVQKAELEKQRREAENNVRLAAGQEPVKYRKEPSSIPDPKRQKSYTDPDSRIMKDGATGAFLQGYNGQIVVDSEAQVIVACGLTQNGNDVKEVIPLVEEMEKNLGGEKPDKISCDGGYFSEENIEYLSKKEIDAYIPAPKPRSKKQDNQDKESSGDKGGNDDKDGKNPPSPPDDIKTKGRIPKNATKVFLIKRKLKTKKGKNVYKFRKAIVEPVFGQIKSCRKIRSLGLRGLTNVTCEWTLICLTHNILKLFGKKTNACGNGKIPSRTGAGNGIKKSKKVIDGTSKGAILKAYFFLFLIFIRFMRKIGFGKTHFRWKSIIYA